MSDRMPPTPWTFGNADFGQPPFNWRPVLVFAVIVFLAALAFGN